MVTKQIKQLLSINLLVLAIWGCGSSAEYTTAKMAIKEENWEKAEEFLLKAMEVEPENAEVMVQIGYYVHAKKSEWTNMNKMFDRAISVNPDATINSRPINEVIKNYRSMFWADNYNKAIRSYNLFKQSNNKEELQVAIDLFNQSIDIDPDEGQTYAILANCYYELGDNESAIAKGRQAAILMPNEFQPNMTLGQLLFMTGSKQEGIKFVEKAIQIDPSNSGAIVTLATYFYESGNTEKAIETFQMAIDKQEDKIVKADIYYNLGVLHMQLNNFDEADIAFEEAYYFNEEDFEALVGMATIYEQIGDRYFNGTEENFQKDYYKAERWYKKARSKYRDLNNVDPDNQSNYQKSLNLIEYKLNISIENQN